MENYSETQRNKLLIYVWTWMNLKKHYAEQRSQTYNSIYYMILFIWNFIAGKSNLERQKAYQWLSRARNGIGWWVNIVDCKGARGNFGGDGKVLHINCGGGYMGVCFCQHPLNYTLKMDVFYLCNLYVNKDNFKNTYLPIKCIYTYTCVYVYAYKIPLSCIRDRLWWYKELYISQKVPEKEETENIS